MALMALSGVLAALVADLSALSKAETERIWLTFGVVAVLGPCATPWPIGLLGPGGGGELGDPRQPPVQHRMVKTGDMSNPQPSGWPGRG